MYPLDWVRKCKEIFALEGKLLPIEIRYLKARIVVLNVWRVGWGSWNWTLIRARSRHLRSTLCNYRFPLIAPKCELLACLLHLWCFAWKCRAIFASLLHNKQIHYVLSRIDSRWWKVEIWRIKAQLSDKFCTRVVLVYFFIINTNTYMKIYL